ncbi:MAG: NusG domain II-containing protein [Eubacteriales bacterium]|nr:NusG domain II-containing protein [Eubacteriales bacterium]
MLLVFAHQSPPWYRLLKWGDYLIYILITCGAIVLFLQGPLFLKPVIGGEALVRIDGLVTRTISAAELAGTGQFDLDAHGFHYTVEYAQGQVRISHADCPDQVCVQTGWVSRQGEVAACVPGSLILSVEPGANSPIDPASTDPDTAVDVVLK